jgi:hypothetical protein
MVWFFLQSSLVQFLVFLQFLGLDLKALLTPYRPPLPSCHIDPSLPSHHVDAPSPQATSIPLPLVSILPPPCIDTPPLAVCTAPAPVVGNIM